jgi:hypothetical protein
VVGVGTGRTVSVGSIYSFNFGLVSGTSVTTNGNYTFGFINALVDGSGTPTVTSTGTVDWDDGGDSGQGLGGADTTNNWLFTPSDSNTNAALGTIYSTSGGGFGSPFLIEGTRTYSASLAGEVAPIPEPASLLMLASGVAMLALRRRQSQRP